MLGLKFKPYSYTNWLTNSMKQSPSWEVKIASKFPAIYETRRFIIVFTRPPPPTGPYSEPDKSSPHPHNLSNPLAGDLPPVGCQYIRSYPPYLEDDSFNNNLTLWQETHLT
jgi:hypothetical protein